MRKHLGAIALILATVCMWFISYPHLPAEIPMQWGPDGSVNWFAPKAIGALLNVGILIVIYPILVLTPRLDPKRKGYLLTSKAYWVIVYATMVLLVFVNAFVIFKSLGVNLRIEVIIPLMIGILFIIIGNYMQTVKANWFLGIRTPWTLSSEAVWRKTHRLGAKLFILTGLSFFIVPFINSAFAVYFIVIGALMVGLIPTIYSYIIYQKEQKEE
ncbi:putative membrane protein [Streptohalobacillus salinus]|uniref:Putative membrane protein n=2 Tax=Streptohalobacillus salinus TaxID=621096 RepID=A0A2V3W5W4_9BACI|nr:putative membrane protein [Streptohalobacillus salinus]